MNAGVQPQLPNITTNNPLFVGNNLIGNQSNLFQMNAQNNSKIYQQNPNSIDAPINNNKHSEKNIITFEPNNNDNISVISNSTNQQINFQNEVIQQINSINKSINIQNQVINSIEQRLDKLTKEQNLINAQISAMSKNQKNIGDQINSLQLILQQIQQNNTNNSYNQNNSYSYNNCNSKSIKNANNIAIFKYNQLSYDVEFNAKDNIFEVIKRFRKKNNDYRNKKFIYNGTNLDPNLTCFDAGLVNNAIIIVNDS